VNQSTVRERYERIWAIISGVPEGCVVTYGQVADMAGFPRGARFAGTALRNTPDSLSLPWHRVINSRGESSFPKESPAWKKQKSRLEREGVTFVNGRVDLQRYRWQPSLDEYLWKPRD
jgi:methylated-DNA-protein-cysteine methyltransferase-like protein